MRHWIALLVLGALVAGCGQMAPQAELGPSLAPHSTDGSYCYSRYNFEDPITALDGITVVNWAPGAVGMARVTMTAACGAASFMTHLTFTPSVDTGVIQAVFTKAVDIRNVNVSFYARMDPPPPPNIGLRFVFNDQRQQWVGNNTIFHLEPGWNHLEANTGTLQLNAGSVIGFIIQILNENGGTYEGDLWIDEISW